MALNEICSVHWNNAISFGWTVKLYWIYYLIITISETQIKTIWSILSLSYNNLVIKQYDAAKNGFVWILLLICLLNSTSESPLVYFSNVNACAWSCCLYNKSKSNHSLDSMSNAAEVCKKGKNYSSIRQDFFQKESWKLDQGISYSYQWVYFIANHLLLKLKSGWFGLLGVYGQCYWHI